MPNAICKTYSSSPAKESDKALQKTSKAFINGERLSRPSGPAGVAAARFLDLAFSPAVLREVEVSKGF